MRGSFCKLLAGVTSVLVVSIAVAATDAVTNNAPGQSTPKAHFRVADPAALGPARANNIYRRLIGRMREGYALSGDSVAASYLNWRRFSTAPYRSSQHGNRFVQNYGNDVAKAYGRYEQAGTMPSGAILAKDSFSVSKAGDVFPGPLFVMEKMAPGFDPAGGDWRYSMIMPDGSVYGRTRDVNADQVVFCADCHAREAAHDYLFFLPPTYRVE